MNRPETLRLARLIRQHNRRRFRLLDSRPLQDVAEIESVLCECLCTLRGSLAEPTAEEDMALGILETMLVVCVSHMKKTSHEALLSEARTATIAAYMNGTPVIRGAA